MYPNPSRFDCRMERKRWREQRVDTSLRSCPSRPDNTQGEDKESQWPGKAHREAVTLSGVMLGDCGLRTQSVALVTVSLPNMTNCPAF